MDYTFEIQKLILIYNYDKNPNLNKNKEPYYSRKYKLKLLKK
jgi:hypothetical protein